MNWNLIQAGFPFTTNDCTTGEAKSFVIHAEIMISRQAVKAEIFFSSPGGPILCPGEQCISDPFSSKSPPDRQTMNIERFCPVLFPEASINLIRLLQNDGTSGLALVRNEIE